MHGIGNDFVVLDCRTQPFTLTAEQIRRLGDRHFGVGFDQLLTIEPAMDASCAFRYGIYNQDGSPAGQCGNGVRCVATWLARAGALKPGAVRLQSPSSVVTVELLEENRVRVEMGIPQFQPAAIPLLVNTESESYTLILDDNSVNFGAVSLGNPHAVIEVSDIGAAPVEKFGPSLTANKLFPQSCNVGFAKINNKKQIALRVWERGVGETLACGSGACAAVAVLHRQGKIDKQVRVTLRGGELEIEWDGLGTPIWMTGPTEFVFEGEWGYE